MAIRKAPEIISKIKVVWLGGNTFLTKDNSEFNFRQDINAVQTVFESKVELVVIPCRNVASNLSTTIYELGHKVIFVNDLYRNKIYQDFFIKMRGKC